MAQLVDQAVDIKREEQDASNLTDKSLADMLGIETANSGERGGKPFSNGAPSSKQQVTPRDLQLSKDHSKDSLDNGNFKVPSGADGYNVASDIMQIVVQNS